jgi:YesN/AraC family two-component response regulator
LKVGLLDDENHPRILLTEIIGSIPGFEISFSLDDPFRALELLQNRAADILITDIKMPGFSGLELSRKINHLEIPIIICSGHTEFGVESFKVNAIHFILKPPGMIEVSEALTRPKISLQVLVHSPPPGRAGGGHDLPFVPLTLLNNSFLINLCNSMYIRNSID